MTTIIMVCTIATIAWTAASCAVALVVARSIKIADLRRLEDNVHPDGVTQPGTTASTAHRR